MGNTRSWGVNAQTSRIVYILMATAIVTTAVENVSTYIDISVYGNPEVGLSRYLLSYFGLVPGLVLAFILSSAPAIICGIYCIRSLRSTVIAMKPKVLNRMERSSIAFLVLGGASLYNVPAAANDLLAPLFGGGPLVPWINVLKLFFIGVGFIFAYLQTS